MFKVECDSNGKPLDNVWFYRISAKRYCLYSIEDNKINILKHSSHGLGGLIGISEDEVKNIWKDILDHHYNRLSKEVIESKYSNKFVMGKLALTSPFVLQCFRRTNKDKRLKPFNFVIVGIGHRLDPLTREPIIPILAYTKTQISCHSVRLLITKLVKSTKIIRNSTGNCFQNSFLATWITRITSTMEILES